MFNFFKSVAFNDIKWVSLGIFFYLAAWGMLTFQDQDLGFIFAILCFCASSIFFILHINKVEKNAKTRVQIFLFMLVVGLLSVGLYGLIFRHLYNLSHENPPATAEDIKGVEQKLDEIEKTIPESKNKKAKIEVYLSNRLGDRVKFCELKYSNGEDRIKASNEMVRNFDLKMKNHEKIGPDDAPQCKLYFVKPGQKYFSASLDFKNLSNFYIHRAHIEIYSKFGFIAETDDGKYIKSAGDFIPLNLTLDQIGPFSEFAEYRGIKIHFEIQNMGEINPMDVLINGEEMEKYEGGIGFVFKIKE